MKIEGSERSDYQKYYIKNPKNFSPERNKAIIDQTIKEYEDMRSKRMKGFYDDLGERIDAAASYLMYLERGGSSAEKYFGKKELARLRGEKIREIMIKGTLGNVIKLA